MNTTQLCPPVDPTTLHLGQQVYIVDFDKQEPAARWYDGSHIPERPLLSKKQGGPALMHCGPVWTQSIGAWEYLIIQARQQAAAAAERVATLERRAQEEQS